MSDDHGSGPDPLDEGERVSWDGRRWVPGPGIRQLLPSGEVAPLVDGPAPAKGGPS